MRSTRLALEALLQEGQHGGLLGGQVMQRARQLLLDAAAERLQQRAVEVGVDDGRVDVALAADGLGVAQALGHRLDGRDDVVFGLRLRVERRELLEGAGGQDGAGPGAEVLGRELLAGDLVQVLVHVGRADRARLAVPVEVLEQFVAGRSWQRRTTWASWRSVTATSWRTPLLPRKVKRTLAPSTWTWRSRRVVRPKEPFSRAYSSLPTRIRVVSSRRTTVASTLRRGRPGRARSFSTRARICGSANPKAIMRW